MTFFAVSGGAWSRRPAAIDTLWRLQNVQETLGPWSLNELEFYVTWWRPVFFFPGKDQHFVSGISSVQVCNVAFGSLVVFFGP